MWGNTEFIPERDIPDLSGKVILVTGGNTGLGKETVLQLAKHKPAKIFLTARSEAKAQQAISDVRAVVPNAPLEHLIMDLSSFQSVRAAATKFLQLSPRLDVLINNAGIMGVPEGHTREGYEIQFGTNHLGHFLLTSLLIQTLLRTSESPGSDVRIINLSSFGHNMAPSKGIDFEDLDLKGQSTWARYGQAKLSNLLHAKELARRYPGIRTVAVHPGFIRTELYTPGQNGSAIVKYFYALFAPLFFQDVPKGARNQLWAATMPGVESGNYYVPVGKVNQGSSHARNQALATKLWEFSEDAVKKA